MFDNSLVSIPKVVDRAQETSGLDIPRLLTDLVKVKHQLHPRSTELTTVETMYLCLSLAGYSRGQAAYCINEHGFPTEQELRNWPRLVQCSNNLSSEMSGRIHNYLKILLDLNPRLPSWRKTIGLLHQKGYSTEISLPTTRSKALLIVEGAVQPEHIAAILKQAGINVQVTIIADDQSEIQL
jgi:hypothetical protein